MRTYMCAQGPLLHGMGCKTTHKHWRKMISKTLVALKAVLDLDPTITEEHREGIIQFAINDAYTVANILREHGSDEMVSIEKAADILGKSKPTVARYLKAGTLSPVVPKGKTRAIGVTMESIRALMGQCTSHTEHNNMLK